ATLTDFGPVYHNMGLAVGLYSHVEIAPREDDRLIVETEGQGAGHYALGLRHPVVLGMMRFFQRIEQAPLGVTVRVKNEIPLNSGLGAEVAFITAGVIGANNLMGNLYNRTELIELAAEISGEPGNAVTAILGGLTTYVRKEPHLYYRSLPLTSFKLLIAVPRVEDYQHPKLEDNLPRRRVLDSMSRVPLLQEALRQGDIRLLSELIDVNLLREAIQQRISGFRHVAEVARLAGAMAVTTSGGGPAMVFLTEERHDRIAEVIETAFGNLDIAAEVFVVPLDTQGIVISMMQTRS
ncbi:MAG: hypothetical protein KC496_17000, partial [Anaerolineae bacterium]|nr:hypothetical protein [Anaerolineae bacterium]